LIELIEEMCDQVVPSAIGSTKGWMHGLPGGKLGMVDGNAFDADPHRYH
jgi:hypothetical protein